MLFLKFVLSQPHPFWSLLLTLKLSFGFSVSGCVLLCWISVITSALFSLSMPWMSYSLSLSPMHCVPSQGLLGRHTFQPHPRYTSCDHFSLHMHYLFSNLGFIVTELSPFMQYKCFIFLCRQLIPFVSLLLLFKSFNLSQGYL